MTFGKWPEEMHYEPEQLLRIERARQIQSSDVQVDRDGFSAIITGSKKSNSEEKHTYYVTADSCSCADFSINRKPCKHMYRLAIECGIINSYSSEQFQEAIGAIENLPDEAQQFLTTVLGIVAPLHYGNLWVTYDEQETLITNVSYHSPSFSPVPLEWLSANPYLDLVRVSLEMLSSREIFNVIENLGFQVDEDCLLSENRKNL